MSVSSLRDRLIVVNEYEDDADKKNLATISRLITAIGNFSVQYNFQSIGIALIVMSASVCTASDDDCKQGIQSGWVMSSATATVFIGAITGQLSMGYAGDVFGRNAAMTFTLSLVSIAALLSAVAPSGSPTSIYIVIIIARFILGIGVGGVYPLSATKAAEDGGNADGKVDVTAASWAFFWQVPGSMAPWMLAYIFSYCSMTAELRWRLLLGLGAVPSSIVVGLSILESRIKKRVQIQQHLTNGDNEDTKNVLLESRSTKYRAEDNLLSTMLQQKETWFNLIATGGGWFIYDVAYYGVNLFGGEILKAINATDDDNVSAISSVRVVSQEQLIALGTAFPACILAIWTLKKTGTKILQVAGFLLIAFCFLLLAVLFAPLSHGKLANTDALFAVYCLLLFSLSYGPNLTTFILPAETYPKEVRSTFNGISAASGKLGAFTGVYVFGPVAESSSYPTVMIICAVLSVIGAVISHFFITIKESPVTLKSSGEDANQVVSNSERYISRSENLEEKRDP